MPVRERERPLGLSSRAFISMHLKPHSHIHDFSHDYADLANRPSYTFRVRYYANFAGNLGNFSGGGGTFSGGGRFRGTPGPPHDKFLDRPLDRTHSVCNFPTDMHTHDADVNTTAIRCCRPSYAIADLHTLLIRYLLAPTCYWRWRRSTTTVLKFSKQS